MSKSLPAQWSTQLTELSEKQKAEKNGENKWLMVLQLLVMVAPHAVACEQTSLPHFFKSGFRGWLSGDNLQQTRPPEFTFPKDAHQKHVGKKLFSPPPDVAIWEFCSKRRFVGGEESLLFVNAKTVLYLVTTIAAVYKLIFGSFVVLILW